MIELLNRDITEINYKIINCCEDSYYDDLNSED